MIESQGRGSFISDDPESIIQSGNYNKVNWITGFTEDDGAIFDIPSKNSRYVLFSLKKNYLLTKTFY